MRERPTRPKPDERRVSEPYETGLDFSVDDVMEGVESSGKPEVLKHELHYPIPTHWEHQIHFNLLPNRSKYATEFAFMWHKYIRKHEG